MLHEKALLFLIFLGLGLTNGTKAMIFQVIAPLAPQHETLYKDKVSPREYKLQDINKYHPYWQWMWD
jgi:hypothetical protein